MTPTYLHPLPLPSALNPLQPPTSDHNDCQTSFEYSASNTTSRERPPCTTFIMSGPGLPGGQKYTLATPSKPSPLRMEITPEMAALDLGEGEKTPTQESYARESIPFQFTTRTPCQLEWSGMTLAVQHHEYLPAFKELRNRTRLASIFLRFFLQTQHC